MGAALLTSTGKIYTGSNVENASYSLTVCAERVAVFKAVSEGEREFKAIAIATDVDEFVYPCGACRQVLSEFCADLEIILINASGKTKTVHLKDIFPGAFHLQKDG